jgi:hypothetical protein
MTELRDQLACAGEITLRPMQDNNVEHGKGGG